MSPGPETGTSREKGFSRSVPSRMEEIDGVCTDARRLLAAAGLEIRQFDTDLLLREFMTNAIEHGNRLAAEKRVSVNFRIGPRWIVVRIADEGNGFPWRKRHWHPPGESETSGRGLAIGALYARRVRYNSAGNQVTIWISKSTEKESQGQ